MTSFFDPTPEMAEVFPMYGTGHAILLALLVVFVVLLAVAQTRVVSLARNRTFIAALSWIVIGGEIVNYTIRFVYGFEPFFERLPFHLCGTLAFLIPALALLRRNDLLQFFAGWSVAAGLISFLNLGMTHYRADNWYFYNYMIRHYYLFLFPVFLFIAGEIRFNYRQYAKSMAALVVYSGFMFFVNWIFSVNYLYIGPNNTMAVPFLPDSWLEWPFIYPSFVGVGVVLFHLIYLAFAAAQWNRRRSQ